MLGGGAEQVPGWGIWGGCLSPWQPGSKCLPHSSDFWGYHSQGGLVDVLLENGGRVHPLEEWGCTFDPPNSDLSIGLGFGGGGVGAAEGTGGPGFRPLQSVVIWRGNQLVPQTYSFWAPGGSKVGEAHLQKLHHPPLPGLSLVEVQGGGSLWEAGRGPRFQAGR